MTIKVLESTDTAGQPFGTNGGRYQIIVSAGGSAVNVQVERPNSDPPEFIDANVDWNDDGVQTMWLSIQSRYRLVATPAGAEAWVMPIDRLAEF